MRLSNRGSASRSFLIVLAVVILGVVGYVGWALLHPDPYAVSERVARDARREVAAEVREFQRELDALLRKGRQGQKDADAAVDRQLTAALQGIDDVVDGARNRLSDLDVGIRTQRNRLDRIEGRADEARELVRELAEEAKQKMGTTDAAR